MPPHKPRIDPHDRFVPLNVRVSQTVVDDLRDLAHREGQSYIAPVLRRLLSDGIERARLARAGAQ